MNEFRPRYALVGTVLALALTACTTVRNVAESPPVLASPDAYSLEQSSTSDLAPYTEISMGEAADATSQHPVNFDGYRRFMELAQGAESTLEARSTVSSARYADLTRSTASSRVRTANTRNLEVHFIDVGQGDSTLVLCPNGKTILVDAGSLSDKDEVAISLTDYIHEQLPKISPRIDTVVVTHPDADHFNLLPTVLEGLQFGKLFHVGMYEGDYGATLVGEETNFEEWLGTLPPSKVKLLGEEDYDKQTARGSRMDCGEAEVHLLAANIEGPVSKKNGRSIVLRLSYKGIDVILTGDATTDTEKKILERYSPEWLRSEVLKLGHHGSLTTSSSPEWITAVAPQIAIASSGWKNTHGHPRKEVVERVEPYTARWTSHALLTATGTRNNYKWMLDRDYTDAVFNTATNSTVVLLVTPQGAHELHWFEYE